MNKKQINSPQPTELVCRNVFLVFLAVFFPSILFAQEKKLEFESFPSAFFSLDRISVNQQDSLKKNRIKLTVETKQQKKREFVFYTEKSSSNKNTFSVQTSDDSVQINFKKFPIEKLNFIFSEQIGNIKGELDGTLRIKWKQEAKLTGTLAFTSVFSLQKLNSEFRLVGEIHLRNDSVFFEKTSIFDSEDNPLQLSGNIACTGHNMNITTKTDNFLVLDKEKRESRMLSGKLYTKQTGRIWGNFSDLKISKRITILKNSLLKFSKRDADRIGSEREGLVEFVSSEEQTSELEKAEHSFFNGIQTEIKIEVEPGTRFQLFANTAYDDYADFYAQGKVQMVKQKDSEAKFFGTLQIDSGIINDGRFLKTLQVLPGGRLFWDGQKIMPHLSLKSEYRVKARPYRLFSQELAAKTDAEKMPYRKKVPLSVILLINGGIENPVYRFNIQLPPEHQAVLGGEFHTKLNFVNESPHRSQLEATSLIGFKRFSGSKLSGAKVSRFEYVSQLLAKLLLTATRKKMKGYDIRIDMYAYDDYGQKTGETTRKELEVSLSKEYLKNRLRFELSSVFTMEKSAYETLDSFWEWVIPSGAVSYYFTPEGIWFGRLFSETAYTGILDGRVRRSGVGFGFSKSFNTLGELFSRYKRTN